MSTSVRFVSSFYIGLVAFHGVAFAQTVPKTAAPAVEEADDVARIVDAMGVKETSFEVGRREKKPPPKVDDPVFVALPKLNSKRDTGMDYLDPFLGREVFPELSAQLSTRFLQEGDQRTALIGQVDLSLWLLDVRIPFRTSSDQNAAPVELLLKAPLGLGRHRLAPMLAVHVPAKLGFSESVVEAGLGYHYASGGFGLKLEASFFYGSFDRTRARDNAGMLAANGVLSYLISGWLGLLVEADVTSALSERADAVLSAGDTLVRVSPGFRIFPFGPGLQMGFAGIFTFVPDGSGLLKQRGALFDISYVFL